MTKWRVVLTVVLAGLGLLGLRPAETFAIPAGGFSLRDGALATTIAAAVAADLTLSALPLTGRGR
jgi:hypothetical protein